MKKDTKKSIAQSQRKLTPMQTLPVYELMRDFQDYLDGAIQKLPQWYRYGYGEDLRKLIISCLVCLSHISRTYDRAVKLSESDDFLGYWDVVYVILDRLSRAKDCLSKRQIDIILRKRNDIEEQVVTFRSWLNSVQLGKVRLPKGEEGQTI